MLKKLLNLIQNIDPQQVQDLMTFISELIAVFQEQSGETHVFGAVAGDESLAADRAALLECCKAKGCDEEQVSVIAAQLPS